MARSGSSGGGGGCLGLIAVLVVIGLILSVAKHHPAAFTIVLLLLIGGAIWFAWARWKGREQAVAAYAQSIEEEKRRWREMPFPEGPCTVFITSIREPDERLYGFLLNLSENPAVDIPDADVLIQRAEHIGRQPVVTDVNEDFAVELKVALEHRGARVKISETIASRTHGLREPIPERVRHEVWRRDSGRCVDCGSRERLEFDHIVPISKGGANTARNIELRCEPCNRKKAATI
jgi:hypothetical protein